jgi:hypothetical protein
MTVSRNRIVTETRVDCPESANNPHGIFKEDFFTVIADLVLPLRFFNGHLRDCGSDVGEQ